MRAAAAVPIHDLELLIEHGMQHDCDDGEGCPAAHRVRALLDAKVRPGPMTAPALVSTNVTYCVTHQATDHDNGRAWEACQFRQLFYFENPMDEHTYEWSDDITYRLLLAGPTDG